VGKRNLAELERIYGKNETNLNPHNEELLNKIKQNKKETKNKQHTTRYLSGLRKKVKKMQREKFRKEMKNRKIVAWGMWEQWFKMGLIGVEEENQPELKVIKKDKGNI
jgi:hypothetical protein